MASCCLCLNSRPDTASSRPFVHQIHLQVIRWLRSPLSRDVRVPIYDVRNAMEQYWVTPDNAHYGATGAALLVNFRTLLAEHNPVAATLRAACELALDPSVQEQDICLKFLNDDAGPEVSAVYHTRDPDHLPPEVQPVIWPIGEGPPKAKPVSALQGNMLAYPALFPTGCTALGDSISPLEYARYLMYHAPLTEMRQFQLSPRVFQEWLLSSWNAVENNRLRFFYNQHSASSVGLGAEEDAAGGMDGDDGVAADDAAAAGADAGEPGAPADEAGAQGGARRKAHPFWKPSFIPTSHMCGMARDSDVPCPKLLAHY